MRAAGFEVPAGQTFTFDPNRSTTVEVPGNVVVRGKLVMRPARPDVVHTLRFVRVAEARFAGGGNNPVASDVGLWVIGSGILDLAGTPKTAWNRTGKDKTWRTGDELITTPTAPGGAFRGGAMPNGQAEIMNLTRNVRIEGTPAGRSHVFIRSSKPQSIRFAAFRYLGVSKASGGVKAIVPGRYALHLHHCGNGSKGSVIEGLVVRDADNRGIVPHASNGIAIRNCIVYRAASDGYWWDPPEASGDNASNGILFEDSIAAAITHSPAQQIATGFTLAKGVGNVIRRCVAVGVTGTAGSNGNGFSWPRAGSGDWLMEDCIAHNVEQGVFVWVENPQRIRRLRAYANSYRDLASGAYRSAARYESCSLESPGGVHEAGTSGSAGPLVFESSMLKGPFRIVDVAVDGTTGVEPVQVNRCKLEGGVIVDQPGMNGDAPTSHVFSSCTRRGKDLERSDFDVRTMVKGSRIRVVRRDGSSFQVTA